MAARSHKFLLLALMSCAGIMQPVQAVSVSGTTLLMVAMSAYGAGWAYFNQPFGYRLDTIEKDLFPNKMNKRFYAADQGKFRFFRWRLNDIELRDGHIWPVPANVLKERESAIEQLVDDLHVINRIRLRVKGKEITPQFTVEGSKVILKKPTLNAVRDMCKEELELLKGYMRGCAWYYEDILEDYKEIVHQLTGVMLQDLLELDRLEWSQLAEAQEQLRERGRGLGEKEGRAAYLFAEVASRYVRLNRIILCLDEYQIARQKQATVDNYYAAGHQDPAVGGQQQGQFGNSAPVAPGRPRANNPQVHAIEQALQNARTHTVSYQNQVMPDPTYVNVLKNLFNAYAQGKPALWPHATERQRELLRTMHQVNGQLLRLSSDLEMVDPSVGDITKMWADLRRIGESIKRITAEAN